MDSLDTAWSMDYSFVRELWTVMWVSFSVKLESHLSRGASVERMHPSDWPVGKACGDMFLFED